MFIDMLQSPFYEHMVGNVSLNFADMVIIGERNEFGFNSGKIAQGPLAATNTKKPGFVPGRRKEGEVQAASMPLIGEIISCLTSDQVINRVRCILLQMQHQYIIHEPVYKVFLDPVPRTKSHLCQIMPITIMWFHNLVSQPGSRRGDHKLVNFFNKMFILIKESPL